VFFDNCGVRASSFNRPTIEELGQALGVVVQSLGGAEWMSSSTCMGGLILRAVSGGKQPNGGFRPPANPGIRKAVFLATPHFGALAIAGMLTRPPLDVQLEAMLPGSPILWDLATWNQGFDDFARSTRS